MSRTLRVRALKVVTMVTLPCSKVLIQSWPFVNFICSAVGSSPIA